MPTPIDVSQASLGTPSSVPSGAGGHLGDPVEVRVLPRSVPTEEATPSMVGVVAVGAPRGRYPVEDPAEDAPSDLMDLTS